MVLSNASKMARKQNLIINRPTCGGTAKKAGTISRVGFFLTSNPSLIRAPQKMQTVCVNSKTVQTQQTGDPATLGG